MTGVPQVSRGLGDKPCPHWLAPVWQGTNGPGHHGDGLKNEISNDQTGNIVESQYRSWQL